MSIEDELDGIDNIRDMWCGSCKENPVDESLPTGYGTIHLCEDCIQAGEEFAEKLDKNADSEQTEED